MKGIETPYVALTDSIASWAKWRPHETAILCAERRTTWSELDQAINRVANRLIKAGLKKGDKVSVVMGNSIETVEIMMGTVKAGGVVVPLSTMLTPESLAAMIDDSDSKFLFTEQPYCQGLSSIRSGLPNIPSSGFVAVCPDTHGWADYCEWKAQCPDKDPYVAIRPEDALNIIYSSGTTGKPKGIVHTHYARQQMAYTFAVAFCFDVHSVALATIPLFSNAAWGLTLLPALTIGAKIVIMTQFNAREFLETVERERCTHTFIVPTQCASVLGVPELSQYNVSSLKALVFGGSPVRPETKQQMLQGFGASAIELYGETEGFGTFVRLADVEGKNATVGLPILDGDIRIIDENLRELPRGQAGEIVGHSSWLMRGYYNKPEETTEILWLDEHGRTYIRSGDVGRLDDDGYLYILDRKKDMIISGGANVFPRDIEEVVARHEQVAEVAVIGIPHEKWGETAVALVVKEKQASLSADELRDWANQRLAKHQKITQVEFCDELPRNAVGKVMKKQLRERYIQKAR
jgi:acyl-CoA synthetase (AMP-forming)/AMP-acid ligase II